MEGVVVVDCNSHYVSFEAGKVKQSMPLEWIELAFDHGNGRQRKIAPVPCTMGSWAKQTHLSQR